MEILLAIFIGALFAGSLYCLLQRSLSRMIIGLMLLGQAANLLVFTAGGLTYGVPALVDPSGVPLPGQSDPLPQALVLTAIVISFGLIAFSLALLRQAYRALGTDDLDTLAKIEKDA